VCLGCISFNSCHGDDRTAARIAVPAFVVRDSLYKLEADPWPSERCPISPIRLWRSSWYWSIPRKYTTLHTSGLNVNEPKEEG
jgi:hypothetical protein